MFLPLLTHASKTANSFPFNTIPSSKTIYIMTSPYYRKMYVGSTKNPGTSRPQNHYSFLHALHKATLKATHHLPRATFLNRDQNRRVYRFITDNTPSSFFFIPLIRMHLTDALAFEYICIRRVGNNALNEDRGHSPFPRPSQPLAKSSRKRCRSRKRSQTKRHSCCSASHPNMFSPALFRETRKSIFFFRLDNLLQNNIGKTVDITFTHGTVLCNIVCIKATFGLSKILDIPGVRTLSSLFRKRCPTGHIQRTFHTRITPIRSTTIHHSVIQFILQAKNIDNNCSLFAHLPPHFWLQLFHTINKRKHLHRLKATFRVRKFIKHYLYISYHIPTKAINAGLSLNLTLHYHPSLHLSSITKLQRLLTVSLSPHPQAFPTRYTTIKPPLPISTIIFNQHKFINQYNSKHPPQCTCKTTYQWPGFHELTLPDQMPPEEAAVLRYLKTPITPKHPNAHSSTIAKLIIMAHKIITICHHPPTRFGFTFKLHDPPNDTIYLYRNNKCTQIQTTILGKLLTNINTHSNAFDFNTAAPYIWTYLQHQHHLPPCDHYFSYKPNIYIWLLQLTLSQFHFSPKNINRATHLARSIMKHQYHPPFSPTLTPQDLIDRYPNDIFFPIDHNANQAARACPVRFHHILTQNFINDTTNFKVLPRGTTLTQIYHQIRSKLPTNYKRLTGITKPPSIAKLRIYIKQDGVRIRPIGTFSSVPWKPLLSLGSRALYAILTNSNLHCFSLYHTKTLKSKVSTFHDHATSHNLHIQTLTFDIKNFFPNVLKENLLPKVDFVFDRFTATHHTNYISIAKPGVDPHQYPPLFRKSLSGKYAYFKLDTLRELIIFSITNAYFTLGDHILKQLVGLIMGDPFSPPLAILYVAFDEHHFQLPLQLSPINHVHILICRYLDDMQCFLATRSNHTQHLTHLMQVMQNNVYEQHQQQKYLTIIQTFDGKFLHADFIIHNNNKAIKMVFHNKNHDILDTHTQNVGRFAGFHDHTHYNHKTNALLALFVLVFDYTTYTIDMIQPIIQLCYEVHLLNYTKLTLISTTINANRTRPSNIWPHIISLIKVLFQNP